MSKAQLHSINFLLLVEETSSLTRLTHACGYENSASLSQLKRRLEQQTDDKSAHGVRPSLAAKLESDMHKRRGWLDRDHDKDQGKAAVEAARLEKQTIETTETGVSTEGRFVTVTRNTYETQVTVNLNLDSTDKYYLDTGVPFLEHILARVACHGLIDLDVTYKGDLRINDHHTVEDIGIVVGQALEQAFGNKAGITRYGHAYVLLDEALSRVVTDLSDRLGLVYNIDLTRALIGRLDVDLFEEFFHDLVNHSVMTLHIGNLSGRSAHHQAETVFKTFGRALRMVVKYDPCVIGRTPSTKGALSEESIQKETGVASEE